VILAKRGGVYDYGMSVAFDLVLLILLIEELLRYFIGLP